MWACCRGYTGKPAIRCDGSDIYIRRDKIPPGFSVGDGVDVEEASGDILLTFTGDSENADRKLSSSSTNYAKVSAGTELSNLGFEGKVTLGSGKFVSMGEDKRKVRLSEVESDDKSVNSALGNETQRASRDVEVTGPW